MVLRFLIFHFRLEAWIATFAYGAATLSLVIDITGRELIGSGVWGAPRFAVYAAISAGFLGMSLSSASGEQIRPQLLDKVVSVRFSWAVDRMSDFVAALLYGALGVLAISFVQSTYLNGETAAVLEWPLWPIQLVLPYSFFALTLRYVIFACYPSDKEHFQLLAKSEGRGHE
ncbi:TRAP transporter small permease [Sneathiella limimaris]|uniref:TRAP transporter small permease n=1 Tax=Sneathiella limimaris TaxID=1964213 RepID=UPI00146B6548|nr:TRAP transporter small permease [Sneathiella limimaris]